MTARLPRSSPASKLLTEGVATSAPIRSSSFGGMGMSDDLVGLQLGQLRLGQA